MNKFDRSYEPHLSVKELSLSAGGEWTPRLPGWSLIQVVSGAGYWLRPQLTHGLEPGALLVLHGSRTGGTLRASQLGNVSLRYFRVEPERLGGLISVGEQRFFQNAAVDEQFSFRLLPPAHALAVKFRENTLPLASAGFSERLRLLQLFIESFGGDFRLAPVREQPTMNARERLKLFLEQAPSSELLELSFADLVQKANCAPRHASRLFKEIAGMSFRDKQTELRLYRARDLLAETESKVVEVAFESGYESLSLFNLMFKRRFGLSPGRWRTEMRLRKRPKRANPEPMAA